MHETPLQLWHFNINFKSKFSFIRWNGMKMNGKRAQHNISAFAFQCLPRISSSGFFFSCHVSRKLDSNLFHICLLLQDIIQQISCSEILFMVSTHFHYYLVVLLNQCKGLNEREIWFWKKGLFKNIFLKNKAFVEIEEYIILWLVGFLAWQLFFWHDSLANYGFSKNNSLCTTWIII